MATTENNYVGDGATVLFPFTFEYIDDADVKVQLNGTSTTEYSLANATTVEMDEAPDEGVLIRVYRVTSTDSMPATFFSGSTIQANDLNDNFNVALFVSQEAQEASTDAANALPVAQEAKTIAQAADEKADEAIAVAGSASTTALDAKDTAVKAEAKADQALQESGQAVSTAEATAQLVAEASLPLSISTISDIPASPSNGDLVKVTNSTGIETFTPLEGLPSGFIGDPGISVQIVYSVIEPTWKYVAYSPNDPDSRYTNEAEAQQIATDTVAPVALVADEALETANDALTLGSAALPRSGGTMSGPIEFAAGQTFSTSGITVGSGTGYGVVKLSSAVDSGLGLNNGVAATPYAVRSAYDRASTAINAASAAMPKTGGQFTGDVSTIRPITSSFSGGSSAPQLILGPHVNSGIYYTDVSNGAIRFAINNNIVWTHGWDGLKFDNGFGNVESRNGSTGYFLKGKARGKDEASYFGSPSSSSSHTVMYTTGDSSGTKNRFYADGSAGNGRNDWGGTSDRRLKENIREAKSQWDDVKSFRFVNYNFISDPSSPQFGVIAQDLKATSPGLVTRQDDGYYRVKTTVLLMKATKALQEAMERIEALEARLNEK